MSEPAISLASCRPDGKCPECGTELIESRTPPVCGCAPCRFHFETHMRKLLAEAIRQRDIVAKTQKRDLNESIEVIQDLHVKLDKAREELAVYRLMLFEVQGRRNFGRGRSRAAMRRRKRRMALLAPKRPSALI